MIVRPAVARWNQLIKQGEVTIVNYFRRMKNLLLIALGVAVFIVLNSFNNTEETDVPFPQEYNSWQLIKATVKDTISKATYANPKANAVKLSPKYLYNSVQTLYSLLCRVSFCMIDLFWRIQ